MASGLIIPEQVTGGPIVLTRRESANRAIALLNSFQQMIVSPVGAGKFRIADNRATLDLSDFYNETLDALGGHEDRIQVLESLVNQITAALANATITCNADGTITLTFPGIDPQAQT
jgi:hypothetical protein